MPEDSENGQEIDWRIVMRSCSKDTRRVARMWLYYTLFYWLVPTFIVIGGLVLARQQVKLVNLIIHGEFLIYAITLTAGSTRLITKDVPKSGPFVNRQAFNLISHIMIFPAIFTYGLLRYIGATSDTNLINTPVVIAYSIVLLIAAFGFSYVVFLIDAQRSMPGDVQKRAVIAITHSPDKLNSDFDVILADEARGQAGVTQADLDRQFDALEDPK